MAGIPEVIAALRREETKLAKQLASIKNAIASLEFGSGGGVPRPGVMAGAVAGGAERQRGATTRRKRTVSAAQRKAQSLKMKAYWAKRKASAKK